MLRPMSLALAIALSSHVAQAGGTQPLDVGVLVGDGVTPATLQVLLPARTRVKVSAAQGQVVSVVPYPGGAIITWIPPVVTEAVDVPLTLKVRGGGIKEDLTYPTRVTPGWSGSFDITFDPPQVAAGASASVKVRPTSPGATTSGARIVKARVSHGTLTALVPGSDGSWVGRYTAPTDVEGPVRPLFLVVDMAAPDKINATAVLAVTNKRSITLDAPADSQNMLKIGDREYGPVKASPAGKVAFEIDLHPDRLTGQLTSAPAVGDPIVSNPTLPVTVPASITIMPLANKAGSATKVELVLACRTETNKVCSPANVKLQASSGKVALLRPDGDTLLRTSWTAAAPGKATLTASTAKQEQTSSVEVIPGPLFLTLSSDPVHLPDGTKDFKLIARAKDLDGKAVTRRAPVFQVPDARLIRRPVGADDGSYTGSWRLNNNISGTQATAWAKVRPTGSPVHSLVAWPAHDVVDVTAGGKLLLYIAAEDATGMPVPGVELSLAVPVGDGSMVGAVKTDASGVVAVPYAIGSKPGPVLINIDGAGLTTATMFWQASPAAPPAAVVPTGSANKHEAIERWRQRVATVAVGPGAAKAATPAPSTVLTHATGPATATPAIGQAVVGTTPVTTTGATAVTIPTVRPSGYARARLRGMLFDQPLTYSAQLKGEAPLFAPEASFTNLFHLGVHGEAELWVGAARTLGFDLRARAGIYRVQLGFEKDLAAPLELEVGARYRAWDTGTWSAYAGGGFARSQSMVFAYSDEDRTGAELKNFAVMGLKAGGGLRGEFGEGLIDLNLQTIWTPGPAILRAEIMGDIPLGGNLLLTGGVAADGRFLRYRVDGSKDNKIKVTQLGLDLRAGVAIPFF